MQIQKYVWGEIFVSQDLVCHICWKHFPRDHHWGQEMEVLIYLYSLAHGAPHYLELAWRYRPGYTLMDALLGSNSSWNQHHRDYINYKLVSSRPSVMQMTVLDNCIGYPGSVHDARVFAQQSHLQALCPPAGYFLLGDGGYPCLEKMYCHPYTIKGHSAKADTGKF